MYKTIKVDVILSDEEVVEKELEYSEEIESELNLEMSGAKGYAREYRAIDGYIFSDLEVLGFTICEHHGGFIK